MESHSSERLQRAGNEQQTTQAMSSFMLNTKGTSKFNMELR